MQDAGDATIPMTHDGYLKLWALQSPSITDYDVLFLDEAQDTTESPSKSSSNKPLGRQPEWCSSVTHIRASTLGATPSTPWNRSQTPPRGGSP